MKILEIAGKNLASFADAFCIQFDAPPFAQIGLFAITGKTGSGKSTILDAMCIALYGQTPRFPATRQQGLKMADDIYISDPRRILRQGCQNCYARVRFLTSFDQTYEAIWSFSLKNKTPKAKRTLENLTTGEKHDIREIEQIIGLNFNQFCHSVLLAQGQFAAFLKMPSADRAALLEHMTDTQIYSYISKATFERFRKEESALEQITTQLHQLAATFDLVDEVVLQEKITQFEQDIAQTQQQLQNAQQAARWHQERHLLDQQIAALTQTRTQTESALTALQTQITQLAPEYLKQKTEIEKHKHTFHLEQEKIAHLKKEKKRYDENAKKLITVNKSYHHDEKNRQQQIQSLHDTEALIQQYEQKVADLKTWFDDHQDINLFFEAHPEFFALLEQCISAEQNLSALKQKTAHITQELITYQHYAELAAPHPDYYEAQIEACSTQFNCYDKLHDLAVLIEELDNKKQAVLQKIAVLKQQYSTIQAEQQTLQTRLETAKQFALSQSQAEIIEKLRELLKPETACPVCGSTDHPLLNTPTDISLLEKARRDEKMIHDLEQKFHHVSKQLNQLEGQLVVLEKNKEELWIEQQNKTQAFSELHTIWLNYTQTPWSYDPAIKKDLQAKQAQLQHQKKEITVYCQLLTKKQEYAQDLQAARHRLAQLTQTLTEILPLSLQSEREKNLLSDFEKRMRGIFTIWCDKKQKYVSLSRKSENLMQQSHAYQQNLVQLSGQLAQQEAMRDQLLEIQKQLDHLFQTQLGAISLANYEQHVHQVFTEATQLWGQLEHEYHALLAQQQQLLGQKKQIDLQQERVYQQKQALSKTHPDFTQVEAQYQIEENQALLNTLHLKLGTLREQLTELKSKQAQITTLTQAQRTQEAIFIEWKTLNELIGSASGQKFQQFAQNLTFEYLLHHANQQLHILTSRYTLKRLENTTNRLEMLVIDHHLANEERSVHSLSGGETFLVSLALALGLASLSSQRVPIYSLFIDEGFGTLDNESLELVLSALERLHLHGKQIGIISHISALSERIQTKINVLARHQGQSIIQIET